MSVGIEQPNAGRRWSAIGVELLPLLCPPLWILTIRYGGPGWLSAFNLLIFATGIGWLIVGRWRAALAVSVGRLAVLAVPFGVLLFVVLSEIDLDCRHGCSSGSSARDIAAFSVLIVLFVVTTIASAGWLAWSTRSGSSTGDGVQKRALAIALELLPLAASGLWPYLFIGGGGTWIIFPLAFTSGLGWLVLGRAQLGFRIALGRGAILACLYVVLHTLPDRHTDWTPVLAFSLVVFVAITLASAAALAWASRGAQASTTLR